jgi:hypothetical protein
MNMLCLSILCFASCLGQVIHPHAMDHLLPVASIFNDYLEFPELVAFSKTSQPAFQSYPELSTCPLNPKKYQDWIIEKLSQPQLTKREQGFVVAALKYLNDRKNQDIIWVWGLVRRLFQGKWLEKILEQGWWSIAEAWIQLKGLPIYFMANDTLLERLIVDEEWSLIKNLTYSNQIFSDGLFQLILSKFKSALIQQDKEKAREIVNVLKQLGRNQIEPLRRLLKEYPTEAPLLPKLSEFLDSLHLSSFHMVTYLDFLFPHPMDSEDRLITKIQHLLRLLRDHLPQKPAIAQYLLKESRNWIDAGFPSRFFALVPSILDFENDMNIVVDEMLHAFSKGIDLRTDTVVRTAFRTLSTQEAQRLYHALMAHPQLRHIASYLSNARRVLDMYSNE